MRYIKRKVVQSVATILAIIMVVTTSPLNAVRAIDLQALEKDRLNVQLDSTQDLLNTVDVNSMQRSEPQEQNATDVLTDIEHSGWTVLTNDNAATELEKGYGSYYLTDDLSVDITISKPEVLNAVTICLDEHSITGTITVESGAVLNIYDCQRADHVRLEKIINQGGTINLDSVNSVIGEIENASTGTDAFSTLNITRGSVKITGKVFNSAADGAVSTINITEIENPVIQGDVTNENGTNGKAAVLNFEQIEIDGPISNTGGAAATLNLTDSTVKKAITNSGTVNLYGCFIQSGIDNKEATGVLNIQDDTVVSNGITSDIGTVNLYDATVTNDSGNAIEVAGGTLNSDSTTVTGGTNGVHATNSATLNLKDSTITGQANQGIDAAWLEAPGAINVEDSEISGAQNGISSVGTGVHAINIVDSTITGTTQYGIYNTGEGAINFGGETAITGVTSDIYTDISVAAYAYAKEYTGEDMSIRYAGELDPIQTIFVTNTENSTAFTVTDSTGDHITCQKTGTNWASQIADHADWTAVNYYPYRIGSGNYYLDKSYNSGELIVDGEVNLCLHGFALKIYAGDFGLSNLITIKSGSTLNLYDCSENGTGALEKSIVIEDGATLNWYGGEVTGHITNQGNIVMQGGSACRSITNAGGSLIVRSGRLDCDDRLGTHEYTLLKNEDQGAIAVYNAQFGSSQYEEFWEYIIKNDADCAMAIVGGELRVSGDHLGSGILENKGDCGIYGGYFESAVNTRILVDDSNLKIRGGKFVGYGNAGNDSLIAFKSSTASNCISGGEFECKSYNQNVLSLDAGAAGVIIQGGTYRNADASEKADTKPVISLGSPAVIQGGIYAAMAETGISSYSLLTYTGGKVSADDMGMYIKDTLITGGCVDEVNTGIYCREDLIVAGGSITGNSRSVSEEASGDACAYLMTGGNISCTKKKSNSKNAALYMSRYNVNYTIKGGRISSPDCNALYVRGIYDDGVTIHIEGGTISSQYDTLSVSGDAIVILGGNIFSSSENGTALNIPGYYGIPNVYVKGGVMQGGRSGEGIYLDQGKLYLSGAPLLYGGNADLLTRKEAQVSARTPGDNLVYIGSQKDPLTVKYQGINKNGKIVVFNATKDDLAKFNMIYPTDKTLVYWDYAKCDANGSYDNVTDLDGVDHLGKSTGNLVLFGVGIDAYLGKLPENYLGGSDKQGQYQGIPSPIILSISNGWYVSIDGGKTYQPGIKFANQVNLLYDIATQVKLIPPSSEEFQEAVWDQDAGFYLQLSYELTPKKGILLADNVNGDQAISLPQKALYVSTDNEENMVIRHTSQEDVDVDDRNKRNLLVTMTESGTAFTDTDAENLSDLVAQNTDALTTAKENAEKDKDRVQGVAVIPEDTTLNRNDDSTLGAASAGDIGLLFDALTKEEEEHAHILRDKAEEVLSLTDSDKRAYEYKYADLVEHTNANVWVSSSDGSLMLWPYPEGTDQKTKFQMVHFDGINRDYDILDYEATLEAIAEGSREFIFKKTEKEQFDHSIASKVSCVTTEGGIVCYVPKNGYGMFALTWEPEDAGNLDIKLQMADNVSGIGDNDKFLFRLEMEDEEIDGNYNDLEITNGVAKFSLTPNESVRINELPAGAEYAVTYMPDTPAEMPSHIHDAECGYVEAVAGSPCNHVHDESCGYVAAVEGSQCTHVHSDECYTLKTDCVIAKDEQASENMSEEELAQTPMVLPSLADDHVCTEESGCITKVLNCQHVHDTECGYVETVEPHDCNHVHDDQCGYVAEVVGAPCKYDSEDLFGARTAPYTVTCTTKNATGFIRAGETIEVIFKLGTEEEPEPEEPEPEEPEPEEPEPEEPEPEEPEPEEPEPEEPEPEEPGGGAYHPEYKPNDEDDKPDEEPEESEEIIEEDVPLAETPWLNTEDHYAYIIGYAEDGTVRPQANITRAEVATIFFRLLTDEARDQFWSTSNNFTDVAADAWYNNAISTMVNAGIIQGYEDGTFRPNNNITRAEFAAIASRFMSSGYDVEEDLFTDIANHWARDNINDAAMTKWINGYPDGTFLPDKVITRAEAVTLVNNVLQRKPDKDHMFDTMIKWPDNMDASAWYYEAIQEATNSHDYDLFEGAEYEIWTSLLENRDWAALEKDWVNAHRTGGEVM